MACQEPWSKRDAQFAKEFDGGYEWQLHVANFLRLSGVRCCVANRDFRDSIDDIERFKHDMDIVCHKPGRDVVLQVKSRNEAFTTPSDIRFPSGLFVMTQRAWDKCDPRPDVVVSVSRPTGAMLWTPCSWSSRWTLQERFDATRRIMDKFLCAKPELWLPIPSLVAKLTSP